MTSARPDEPSAIERAEVLIKEMEEEIGRLARSALARVSEIAEDLWAEAQGARKNSSER